MASEILTEDTVSEIQRFYEDKTIFITGASGFLGRLLLEKLLRSCKGLKRIYILLREKKGKHAQDRFKDIFDVPMFETLKTEQPDFLSKISILEGDLILPNVGLSQAHITIVKEEVDCIFHVGATVRFDEKLRTAAFINVRSVRDLLRLAREMKHLKSFIHVSTAFSNCGHSDINETFYETAISGSKLLDLVDCLDEQVLDKITPILLQDIPNTYVFTKAIAEEVVKSESKGLPVAICRPSIVISTYKEPVPGWLDNIYGPTSILLGAALGLLRSLHGRRTNVADLVPADFVVNCIIASGWDTANSEESLVTNSAITKKPSEPKIFNYVSRPENPITWGQYQDMARESALKIPSPMIIWHSTFDMHSNYYVHWVMSLLMQTIPAYVIDFFAALIGKKPTFVQAFKKIDKFCGVIAYFTTRQWNFKNENTQNLHRRLNATDKKLFNFSMASMSWRDFFYVYLVGARVYLLKDPLETIPAGRRKLIAVRIGHYVVVTILCLLFYKFFMFLYSVCC